MLLQTTQKFVCNGYEKLTLRDIAPVSKKQHYANICFPIEHPTTNKTKIYNQPEEVLPSRSAIEDQHSNDN